MVPHQIIFARSYLPISLGIQVVTACKWSHVAWLLHNARVFGVNPHTGNEQILGRIALSNAGNYDFKVPGHYLNFTEFAMDDAYGVIQ